MELTKAKVKYNQMFPKYLVKNVQVIEDLRLKVKK